MQKIPIEDLLTYIPKSHGEHGVDSTLHVLCSGEGPLNIVFANPPGGSWTQFDLLHPETNDVYRWDHIPRAPTAQVKRPDLVLQLNQGKHISLLSVESKLAISAIEVELGIRLTSYFTGAKGFTGIKQRPAWHYKKNNTGKSSPEVIEGVVSVSNPWILLPPDAPEDKRFWFRDYPEENISFWSGFAYALTPEVYEDRQSINTEQILQQHRNLLSANTGLDVIVAVGWKGLFREPFVLYEFTDRFAETEMARGLKIQLAPATLRSSPINI